ncbi:hypothetical protein [Tardibacter chloracetimidivorans]|uniref:hypothetical protein n=1 Tax=Tardibacter chloracetimidivorans TaxID=1921510 RepID=UPI0013015919|nr:hypothetical protein [Tardibacter chloracetimidivorans]
MIYRKQENAFRKCRDALCDGPDDPLVLVVMMIAMFGGLLAWIKIVYTVAELFK